ncbi:MAG: helix-turn-helix domain-containing protein [Rubrivivax sp.]
MPHRVKSASRVLVILELFERERRPLSLIEIWTTLGYPRSSTAVLLKTLVGHGYLHFDRSSQTYCPTMRLAAVGGWVEQSVLRDVRIADAIGWLQRRTSFAVVLAGRTDTQVQYLHIAHPADPLSLRVKPGDLRPLAGSAMGWALLAAYRDAEIEHIVRRINHYGLEPRVELAALMQRIREVRRDGVAFSRGCVTPGFGMLSVLLPASVFDRHVALGLTGSLPAMEGRLAALIRLLKQFSAGLAAEEAMDAA